MATNLNRSLDNLFNKGPGRKFNKTYAPTNPQGPNFQRDYGTSRRGAEIRTGLDNALRNLEGMVDNVRARQDSRLDIQADRQREREQRETPDRISTEQVMQDRAKALGIPNFRTIENKEQLEDAYGKLMHDQTYNEDGTRKDGRTEFKSPLGGQGGGLFGPDNLARVGDIASRPIYGVFEGARNMLEAIDEGSNPLATYDDWAYGIGQGLGGYRKTTPGDFMEYATSPDVERNRSTAGGIAANFVNPLSPLAEQNRRMIEADVPDVITDNVNRAGGFVGETLLDPLNLVGGGAVGVAGKSAGMTGRNVAKGARELAEATFRNTDDVITNFRTVVKGKGGRFTGQTKAMIDDVSEQIANDIDEIVITPNRAAVGVNHQSTVDTIAARAEMTVQERLNSTFNSRLNRVVKGDVPVGSRQYRQWVDNDEQFAEFDRLLRNRLDVADELPAGLPIDQPEYLSHVEEAQKIANGFYNDEVLDFGTQIRKEFDKHFYNTYEVRIGGTKGAKIPIKSIGRVNRFVRNRTPLGAPKNLSYNNQLGPGRSGLIPGDARRVGHTNFEEVTRRIREVANKQTRQQREELARLRHSAEVTQENIDQFASPEMAEAYKVLDDEYRKIFEYEKAAGVRAQDDIYVENYQYLTSKQRLGPGREKRVKILDEAKAERRQEVSSSAQTSAREVEGTDYLHLTSPEDVAERMKSTGFQGRDEIVTDPWEALAHRRLKAERLASRAYVSEGYFTHYGVTGRLTPEDAKARGLVKVYDGQTGVSGNGFKANDKVRAYAKENQVDIYLPEGISDVYKNYLRMADFNDRTELTDLLRAFDKVNNFFKLSATVPFPGFHVKNMVGDVWLGYLDGVKAADYAEFTRQFNRADGMMRIAPEVEIPKAEFLKHFDTRAGSSGFVESELFPAPRTGSARVGSVKDRARAVGQNVRELSERREDLARWVHFHKALGEEMGTKGITDKALSSAGYRVNKYKFDYGALTYTEKKWMRRAIPFYTFMRKSAPVMVEGLLTHPSIYGKTHRFFDNNDMNSMAPQWLREIGFATPLINTPFGSPDEPLAIPQNIIPIDSLTTLSEMLEGDWSQAIASTNPVAKTFLEQAFNQNSFTGGKLWEGDKPSFLDPTRLNLAAKNLLPMYASGAREVERISDSTEGFDPTSFDDWSQAGANILGGSRFALGLSARRLTQEDQLNAARSDISTLKRELGTVSDQVKPWGIRVFVSEAKDATSVKVRPVGSRKDLFVGNYPDAIRFVERYVQQNDKIEEGDELVDYVDRNGALQSGPRRSLTSLDRILEN